jgi:hypothetical protein
LRPPRNPFRLRAAEHIESDATFVSLFAPGMLDALPDDEPQSRRLLIRSAAGGGKTSLLRLFTPGPLQTLHVLGNREETTTELYKALRRRQVLDESGPTVAGAQLSLARNYAALDELSDFESGQRDRALLALLNARTVLAALRARCDLHSLRFPEELSDIVLSTPNGVTAPAGLTMPCSADELYEWARALEESVAVAIDSLGGAAAEQLPGDDELSSLDLLGAGDFEVAGSPSPAPTLILLDDAHRLTQRQRSVVVESLLVKRGGAPVWVAERYEALAPEELLVAGAREDRDVARVDLEDHWRGSRSKAFQRLALNVADRRTALAPDSALGSFAAAIESHDDAAYAAIFDEVRTRLEQAAEGRHEFSGWIESQLDHHGTARERTVGLRTLEIRIARELAGSQLAFDVWIRDEEALEQLEKRPEASSIRRAAELLLARDFDLPYYYGAEQLTLLASSNIDQFLMFAGDLFEEIAGAEVLRQPRTLSPMRQELLINRAVKSMWDRLPTSVGYGRALQNLLDGIGQYAAERTYLPNAPYAPGVTGIGIPLADSKQLANARLEQPGSWQARLASLVSSALAHNLLSVQPSEAKGQRWNVLYLNRALCVRYRLPLQYGGWQPARLSTLYEWSESGRVRQVPQALAL